jgi:hypothetical protein
LQKEVWAHPQRAGSDDDLIVRVPQRDRELSQDVSGGMRVVHCGGPV